MKKRLTAGLVAIVALGVAPATEAELRGKVYMVANPQAPRTEWQRVPLPRAFVTVDWFITVPTPAHAVTTCRYSEIARTDENGEYVMEGPNFITARLAHTSYSVYFQGLEPIDLPYGESAIAPKHIMTARSNRAPGERLSMIALFTDPGCFEVKLRDPRGLLVPYLQSVLDEGQKLNVDSPRGRRDLEHIEAALRRASGLETPQPLRAVPAPSPGAIQADTPAPGSRP